MGQVSSEKVDATARRRDAVRGRGFGNCLGLGNGGHAALEALRVPAVDPLAM